MVEIIVLALYNLSILIFAYQRYPITLQMFQQNRYEVPRFKQWLSKNEIIEMIDFQAALLTIIILVFSFFHIPYLSIIVQSISVVILMLLLIDDHKLNGQKQSIKPLVVTARVKRLVFTIIFIYTFFIILGICLHMDTFIFMTYLLTRLSPYVTILASIINEPIERLIRDYYLNQAKQKLKKMPHLTTIGITGSYGKTSTKNIMHEILSERYYTLMTPASFNTPMGITKTIRGDLKPTHEVFICEMGADKVGEITELMTFVHPQIGVLTSIGPQHLNTFKTIDHIIKEKFQVIERLPQDGLGVINLDDPLIRAYQIKNTCPVITYGIEQPAMYRAINIQYQIDGTIFDVVIQGDKKQYRFHTRLLGQHNVLNILAAIAVGHHLSIDMNQLAIAVAKVPYIKHRLEVKKQGQLTILDNAFNSNPVGSKISLEVISKMPGQRIIMTPGMIDLGVEEDDLNYQFGTYMKDQVDMVILVGQKQTKMIYKGLKESGFDLKQVHVVDTVQDGFKLVHQLAKEPAILLIENDLPDAFNH